MPPVGPATSQLSSDTLAGTAITRSTCFGGKRIPVPRHPEIDDGLAEKMFRECEEVPGRGWWR